MHDHKADLFTLWRTEYQQKGIIWQCLSQISPAGAGIYAGTLDNHTVSSSASVTCTTWHATEAEKGDISYAPGMERMTVFVG